MYLTRDASKELESEGIKKYQSLIGALQWAVALGRLDITTSVMTMSGFRVVSWKGHMEKVKWIYGYLQNNNNAVIQIRLDVPDCSDIVEQDFSWENSVYGEVKEIWPSDIPRPLGKEVILTTYVDANLYHNMLRGHSVSGILH